MRKVIIMSQIVIFSICLMIWGAVNCPDGTPATFDETVTIHYKEKCPDDEQPDNSQVTWSSWVADYQTFSHDGSTASMTFKRTRNIHVKYKEWDQDISLWNCPNNVILYDFSAPKYNETTPTYLETETEEQVETGTVESGVNPPGSSDYQISTWEVIEAGGTVYTMFQIAKGLLLLLL
ncbi:MAG: hypothetical protein KAU94_03660 [Verrucomicrobia bacterium]|nr:hypothetical protein [Verrucomicrobiota bacterium]